jgi:hypothetical protein
MSVHDHADSDDLNMESPSIKSQPEALKNGDSRSRTSRSPLPKKEPSPTSDTSGNMKDSLEIKQESQRPKLSRSSSQVSRPPPLYTHLPDSTQDALATFEQIPSCIYANKYMGYTELAMECDCAEEWGKFELRVLSVPCLCSFRFCSTQFRVSQFREHRTDS